MSAVIIDFRGFAESEVATNVLVRESSRSDVDAPAADVPAIAARVRAVYLQTFDDTVAIALRCVTTGARHRIEDNAPGILAGQVLARILAEGQLARLQQHAAHIPPALHARQLARVRGTIQQSEWFLREEGSR